MWGPNNNCSTLKTMFKDCNATIDPSLPAPMKYLCPKTCSACKEFFAFNNYNCAPMSEWGESRVEEWVLHVSDKKTLETLLQAGLGAGASLVELSSTATLRGLGVSLDIAQKLSLAIRQKELGIKANHMPQKDPVRSLSVCKLTYITLTYTTSHF